MPDMRGRLPLNFTHHPSTSAFTASSETYKSRHPSAKDKYFGTGALVFDNSDSSAPRILLLQRSAGDSMPGQWEVPGGGVDDDDESILHAVARELWEEAGVNAISIGPLVGNPHFFITQSGKQICKFNFLVSVEGKFDVKLDPEEHQRFVWASEDEARAKRVGDVDLEFTTTDVEATVLEAFRTRKEVKRVVDSS